MKRLIRILTIALLTYLTLSLFVKPAGEANTTVTPTPVVSAVLEKKEKTLEDIAKTKLSDLVTTGHWSHTNSDGCDFKCRTKDLDYKWVGENLYKGPCNYYQAFKSWEASPSHNEILLAPFTEELLIKEPYQGGCYIILLKAIK